MRPHTKVLAVALLAAIVITAILVVGVSGGSEPQTEATTRRTTSTMKPVSNRQAFAVHNGRPGLLDQRSGKQLRAKRLRADGWACPHRPVRPWQPRRQAHDHALVPDGAAAPTLKDNGKPTRELSVVRNVAYTEDTSADEVTQANGTAVKLPPLNC